MPSSHEEIFSIEVVEEVVILYPSLDLGEFLLEQIEAAEQLVLSALTPYQTPRLVVDFARTKSFASAAISLFLKLRRYIEEAGGEMVFCNLSDYELEILRVTRLDTIWRRYDSREDAVVGAWDPPA